MTSAEHTDEADYTEQDRRPPLPAPPKDCDSKRLDAMRCKAKGIAEQAKYNAGKEVALDTARTQFDGARKAYGVASEAAEPLVKAAGKKLDKLTDQLICLINDHAVVARLDEAYDKVAHRLEKCGDQSGCYCRQDCDFDEMRRCGPDELPMRIADIEKRTKSAEDCFADLIQELTKLGERVAAAQAEIDDIETKIATASEPTTLRRLYASALVARRHLDAVRRGFPDVNAYIDCLCQALACMLGGHAAIADLKRRQAEQQCRKDAEEAECKRLRENTVDQVLAEYEKIPVDASGAPTSGDRDEYGDRPPDRPPSYGDRPPDRPPSYGDRPPDRPPSYGDRPPDRPPSYGDRPPDRPPSYGDRPPDRPPSYGDRPPDRPPSYGDRPPDRPPSYGDRPPDRKGGHDNRDEHDDSTCDHPGQSFDA